MIVVGCGHAGASVACAAADAGHGVLVLGRRSLDQANPSFARRVQEDPRLEFAVVDVHQPPVRDADRPPWEQARWVVLAHEPRSFVADADGVDAVIVRFQDLYDQLRRSGFESPHRMVVRIGSPPAEEPTSGTALRRSVYGGLKRRLRRLADDEARRGLRICTVAPAEIHSPWSGYGDEDPYRQILARLPLFALLHDIPTAAVSDRTFGQTVLAAAERGEPGAWYTCSDGVLGPGSAAAAMASELGQQPPTLVTWHGPAIQHLIEVLRGSEPTLDLARLAEHTTGMSPVWEAVDLGQQVGRGILRWSAWWAPPGLRDAWLDTLDQWSRTALQLGVATLGEQVAPDLMEMLWAMGEDRRDDRLVQLSATEHAERLTDAVRRHARSLAGLGWLDADGPDGPARRE